MIKLKFEHKKGQVPPRYVEIRGMRALVSSGEDDPNPLIIDLDIMRKRKADVMKHMDREELARLLRLKTEEDMAEDTIQDYKKMGFRLIKRE